MSVYSSFNLDSLTPERFQELCGAILVNHFSQLVEPHGRPGRDGGVDAELIGEAISYSDLLRKPIPSKASDGSDLLWIFQATHVRQEGAGNREREVIKACKKEIVSWKTKRTSKPTHFYLLTNVNLTRATKRTLKNLGSFFPRFECWGEEKITAFVAGSVALQQAYFPGFARMSNDLARLIEITKVGLGSSTVSGRTSGASRKGGRSKREESDSFVVAVTELVDYEVSFLRANEALDGPLGSSPNDFRAPKDWKRVVVHAPKGGILTLSSDPGALSTLVAEIQHKNAAIVSWHRYLGEQTERGEDIVTVSCHPQRAVVVRAALRRLVKVLPGENTAHLVVDKHLKDIQATVISNIKANRILEAQEGLTTLFRVRREYAERKRQYPTAFYPNMRTLGRRPIFGWDFGSLWERILESIADIAFSGQYPKEFYRRLISLPFELCRNAIRSRLPQERFQAELATTRVIFRILCDQAKKKLFEDFLDQLDELADAVGDTDARVQTEAEAVWAVGISKTAVKYLADLARVALAKRVDMTVDKFLPLIQKCAGLHFDRRGVLDGEISDREEYAGRLEAEARAIGDEYLFALATYVWFDERRRGSLDPSTAVGLLGHVTIARIVDVYESRVRSDDEWLGLWFMPEGKRVTWSGRMDHDIRDALQLAILNVPATAEEYSGLRLLEGESTYREFVRELETLYTSLADRGHQPFRKMPEVLETLAKARDHAAERWRDRVRNQKALSEEKLAEIQKAFARTMREQSPEGFLYLVEERIASDSEKPTHFVGVYSIHEKIWFLAETGDS